MLSREAAVAVRLDRAATPQRTQSPQHTQASGMALRRLVRPTEREPVWVKNNCNIEQSAPKRGLGPVKSGIRFSS